MGTPIYKKRYYVFQFIMAGFSFFAGVWQGLAGHSALMLVIFLLASFQFYLGLKMVRAARGDKLAQAFVYGVGSLIGSIIGFWSNDERH